LITNNQFRHLKLNRILADLLFIIKIKMIFVNELKSIENTMKDFQKRVKIQVIEIKIFLMGHLLVKCHNLNSILKKNLLNKDFKQ